MKDVINKLTPGQARGVIFGIYCYERESKAEFLDWTLASGS
jgi:hypothetical protein